MSPFAFRRFLLSTAVAGVAMLALPGFAQAQIAQNTTTPIDTVDGLLAAGYNTYVEGNMGTSTAGYTSDSQGAIAVGGNAYLSNFSVATGAGGNRNGVSIAVGGNMTIDSGYVYGGVATVHGTLTATNTTTGTISTGGNVTLNSGASLSVTTSGAATLNSWWVNTNTGSTVEAAKGLTFNGSARSVLAPTTAYSSPINFAATTASLKADSATFAAMTATLGDTMAQTSSGYTFTATASGTNVFNVTAAQLAKMSGSQVTFNSTVAGATDVINVVDTGNVVLPSNMSFAFSGAMTDNKVLMNFANASTVTMGTGTSYDVGLMAPSATLVTNSSGNFTGTVMVAALTGGAQLNVASSGVMAAMPSLTAAVGSAAPAPLPMAGTSPLALALISWFRRRDVKRIAGKLTGR